jgi:uncharacterized protein
VSNAEVALRVIEEIPSGVIDPAVLHPDFQAWTLTLGELSRDRYLTALNRMATLFSPRLRIEVIGVTDGGDRVAVEARSTGALPDGSTYRNSYHFLFAFADGLIVDIREYLDTAAVEVIRKFQAARDAAAS